MMIHKRAFVRLLILSIFAVALFLPDASLSTVQAQQTIQISSVRVDVWPEYDQPSALIIYNITLDASVKLPTTLNIRIPAAAGKPHAVAWQSADQALYDLNYTTTSGANWITVSFSTPATDIRIEYYDPTLKINGDQRDFTFHWPADYDVENLTLQIQQPVNASQMTFRPSAGSGQVGSDGMTYYNVLAGKVSAGTTFDLSMQYTKPDDSLTSPSTFQEVQPNQPITSNTSGRIMFTQILPWILGGVGLLLIAIGVFWYLRTAHMPVQPVSGAGSSARHRPSSARAARPNRPVSGQKPAASTGADAENEAPAFCSRCGKKVNPGDMFCRACGSKLS